MKKLWLIPTLGLALSLSAMANNSHHHSMEMATNGHHHSMNMANNGHHYSMNMDENTTPMQQELMQGMDKMHQDMALAMQYKDPDVAFAAGMLPHHIGAVKMAEVELKYGKDPEMRKLAEEIIKAQQGEIELMKKWLEKHKK